MANASDIYSVYAIAGADRFLRTDALDSLLQLLSAEENALGPVRLDGLRVELAEVLDQVRTRSLLGDRQIVVVDEADAFITTHRPILERYCSNPAQESTLIFLCKSLPKNTKLHKIIQKQGQVMMVEALKGRAVVPWLTRRSQEIYDKSLSRHAAQRLFDHLGESAGQLDTELAKLAAYVGQRAEITPADIDTLTGQLREEKVFVVTDAIAQRDIATALKNWDQVLATDRAAQGRAIAGLAWSVRRLLDARRAYESGVDIATLARKIYMDPGLLRQRLESVSVAELEDQQRDLLEADLAIKTGASTLERAVERFIISHGGGITAKRATA